MNKLDATCEQVCMENPRDKYYMKCFRTITDYNNCNDVPFSNENIQDTIHRFISKEEMDYHSITLDSHNVTVDNFSRTSNKQIDNNNTILTSEKLEKLDDMAETLKGLAINNSGYYELGSTNANDAKNNTARNPKMNTHTSDEKGKNYKH